VVVHSEACGHHCHETHRPSYEWPVLAKFICAGWLLTGEQWLCTLLLPYVVRLTGHQQDWLLMVTTAQEHHGAPPFLFAALCTLPQCSPTQTAIFSLRSSIILTRQNKLCLEVFRLLEMFQEFSSVFFDVKNLFSSIANMDIGDISSLPLLLGSSSLLSWLLNHFMGYWDCRLTLL